MMRSIGWALLSVGLAVMSGCDCGGPVHRVGGPCELGSASRPEACDAPCGRDACPPGFYCHATGVCTADCAPGDGTCGAPSTCTADGRCVAPDAGDRLDASRFDASCCAHREVEATRVTPNVVLVIDQSGSMTASFGSSNRWDALRDSLLARPDGLISDLESQVRFGLALYTANAPDDRVVVGECPLIEWVPPELDNYDAIQTVYRPARPIDETPTGDSLDAILDRLTNVPDPSPDPTIFVLATDGEPDTCAQPNPQEGQAQALAAATRAYRAGVRTFIISVGAGTVSARHLQDMANAGLGRGPGDPDAPYWVAGDDAGLRDALRAIVGGELSCVVSLDGRIQNLDAACSGTVTLNGTPLECGGADGWRVVDETHIELVGEACRVLSSGPGVRLQASFPCDVILI